MIKDLNPAQSGDLNCVVLFALLLGAGGRVPRVDFSGYFGVRTWSLGLLRRVSLVIVAAGTLFCAFTSYAAVVQSNNLSADSNFSGVLAVSNTDLLQTNLASVSRTGASGSGDRYFYREDSGYTVDLSRLANGSFGSLGSDSAASVLPNQVTLTFALNSGSTVTSIRTFAGWGDTGRDGQAYTVQYSAVSDPTNFITLAAITRYDPQESDFPLVDFGGGFTYNDTNNPSTMVELTSSSGPLAVNVAAIRFVFGNYDTNTNAFENGGTGYREIDVIGSITSSAPPTVTSISPASGSTAGGTSITITGTNFTGATAVTIGGTSATNITVVSSTSITATTPAGSAGTASVLVTAPGGTNAANTLFTYLSAANNPTFGTPTSTAAGFTVQISNYNANFTYGGTATASGTVSISNTGLITVSGVAANTSSTATITTTRTGYVSGSAQVTATTLAAPGAPTGVSAVRGNAQATVTFTAPASNGGAAITGYTVTSSPAGGTDSNAGSTNLSHVITGLTNGTSYTFTVTATNSGKRPAGGLGLRY